MTTEVASTGDPSAPHEAAERGQRRLGGRVPLGVQIAARIRQHIKAQGLVSGDPLPSESELAEQYGASLRAVRDALRALSNQGIIRTHQGKRAVVSDLRPVAVEHYFRFVVDADADAVDELLELRLALETKAAALAAERSTEEDIAALRRILDDLTGSGTDLDRRIPLDLAFHDGIVRASRNRFFLGIVEALSETLAAERLRGAELTQAVGLTHVETNAQHQALLLALESRDPALAEQCMRAILERARGYFRGDGR